MFDKSLKTRMFLGSPPLKIKEWMKLNAVPYDAEVEYLESTGTQWIDTGVVATSDTHINVRFSDYTVAGAWLFGVRIAYQDGALGVYTVSNIGNNNWLRARGSLVSGSFTYTTIGVGVVTFDYNKATFTATRELVPNPQTFTDTTGSFSSSPYTIYIWSVNLAGTLGNVASAKVYGVKIWDDGVLVRDFQPVRFTNEQGVSEGAMYDKVSRQLFRNAGTGQFIIGPDVGGAGLILM